MQLDLTGKHALVCGGSVGIGSVSYTHLDVYKRQPEGRPAGCPTPGEGASTLGGRCWGR